MRETLVEPTVGARRLCNIPINEFYLGLRVKSLMTGREGIVGDYGDIWDDEFWVDVLWENTAISSHVHSDYDAVEELLEEHHCEAW